MKSTVKDILKGVPTFSAGPAATYGGGGGWNRLRLDLVEWDNFGGVDKNAFRVNLIPGIWRLNASVMIAAATIRVLSIYKNSSELKRIYDAENLNDYGMSGSALVQAAAGDYFECYINLGTGVNINGPGYSFFQGKLESYL